MIVIVPLVPIAIFLFLLASGLVLELSSALPTIHIILAVLVVVAFVILLAMVLSGGVNTGRRIASSVLCAISCILSLVGLNYIIDSLATIESSLLMVFEFALVLIGGGGIWLLLVMAAMWVCMAVAGA